MSLEAVVVTGTATPRTRLETSNATTALSAAVANPGTRFSAQG